jgi:hypothetical protein
METSDILTIYVVAQFVPPCTGSYTDWTPFPHQVTGQQMRYCYGYSHYCNCGDYGFRFLRSQSGLLLAGHICIKGQPAHHHSTCHYRGKSPASASPCQIMCAVCVCVKVRVSVAVRLLPRRKSCFPILQERGGKCFCFGILRQLMCMLNMCRRMKWLAEWGPGVCSSKKLSIN